MTDAADSSRPRRILFSPKRVWTLAAATVTQLMRMKIMGFLLVFCGLVVAWGFILPTADPSQQLKQLKDWSFAALQVFSVVIAIAATALLLPRDLEDRTLYTILSKPVPRYEYLLGKLLGVMLLIGGGLLIMDLVLSLVLWIKQNMLIAEVTAVLKAQKMDVSEAIAQYETLLTKQGLTWNLHLGVVAIFLKASIISALALLISCFASSTLFTIVITLCVTIIGHGHQMMRDYFLQPYFGFGGAKIMAFVLAILSPDLGAFDVIENVISGELISLHAMSWMLGVTAMYMTGYAIVSYLLFVEKEL
jgi:hypothetical protein